MSENEKLLPCPFCIEEKNIRVSGSGTLFWVLCDGCFSRGPTADTSEVAILCWNQRIRPPHRQ